jgi:hypothetical protein
VSKDVRIGGYFSKPKGVRVQKHLGKTAVNKSRTVFIRRRFTSEAGFQSQSITVYVVFVMGKEALWQMFSQTLQIPLPVTIPSMLHIHLLGSGTHLRQ